MEQLASKIIEWFRRSSKSKIEFESALKLNRDGVSRGELAGDAACLDSWHPYFAVGPARQSSACPTARHDAPGRMDSAISTSVRPLSRSSSSPRRRRCFCELARSRLSTSGPATPPRAPPASPLPRHRVGCDCRASGSPHCLLRRELTSPELRRGHRCRGQGSVVHHFSLFLSQKLH